MLFKIRNKHAFTRIECIVLIATITLMLALVKQNIFASSKKYTLSICKYNLMHSYKGFYVFSQSNDNKFPWEVSLKEGGTIDSLGKYKENWVHWQKLSNTLDNPKTLRCAVDKNRYNANTFLSNKPRGAAGRSVNPLGVGGNGSLSYFLASEASLTKGNSIMAGHRNIHFGKYNNGHDSKGAIKKLGKRFSGKSTVTWTKNLHRDTGLISNIDGSIFYTDSGLLKDFLMKSENKDNEMLFPAGKR